jgi:hypothetical protein
LEKLCASFDLPVIELQPYLYGLSTWEPRTYASESSSSDSVATSSGGRSDRLEVWPTATAADARGSGAADVSQASGRHPGLTLTDAVVRGIQKAPQQWPTPASRDWKSSASNLHGHNSRPLNEVVRLEEERCAVSSASAGGASSDEVEMTVRAAEVSSEDLFPTPSATSYGTSNNGSPHDGRTAYATAGKMGLEQMARTGQWATPQARDERGPTGMAGRDRRSSLSDQAMPGAKAGRLNPAWVELLMTFPMGWLEIE